MNLITDLYGSEHQCLMRAHTLQVHASEDEYFNKSEDFPVMKTVMLVSWVVMPYVGSWSFGTAYCCHILVSFIHQHN
jgi:hypothetical protein